MLIAAARVPGFSTLQWAILACAAERPGLSATAVAERLGTARPNVSYALHGLVEGGLVDRSPEDADRRFIRVTLTARGTALLRHVEAAGRP